jgi:His/Glu/Gln/Arg/opine family amino acid ABC transporter permease subunit
VLASFDSHLFWTALSSGPYWRGALLALELTAASLATAIFIGFFVALGAFSRRGWVRRSAWTYNWLFRATPTLLQLFIVWYALPQWWSGFSGRWWTPFVAAWVALSLNEAAYMSEIIRAGLLSVDPGQELAGRALGMSRRRILRRVLIPQAVRIAIPPTGNEFITLLKLTSLASIISLHEILTSAQELAVVKFQYAEPLLAALLYYLAIVSVLMLIQSRLERRFTWTSRQGVPAIGHG